jgi:hypothetical protein
MELARLEGAEVFLDWATNVSLVRRAERVAMCVLILDEARA